MATRREERIAEIRSGARGEADFGRIPGCKRVNGRGFDLIVDKFKIEVRTRLLGTDNGERGPRITLTALKIATADILGWAHYDEDGELIRAWLVPIRSLVPLYAKYRQSNGQAHLPWEALTRCRGARDVTAYLAA